jgi:hypothetical protein
MIDPIANTKYHPDLRLQTWFPDGVLNNTLATQMISYVAFEEKILDEPFNRFADLSRLSRVDLDFMDVADYAAERRQAYAAGAPVKSAFLAKTMAAYAIAKMFAALMEDSPIEVRVFRQIDSAARWLEVPVEALQAESL